MNAPKISKERHSKHLEINLEAKTGTSQVLHSIKETEDFDPEILSTLEEDNARSFQLAVQSSNLLNSMIDLLSYLYSMLAETIPKDTNTSLLFQSLGGLINLATSSENSMPPSKDS